MWATTISSWPAPWPLCAVIRGAVAALHLATPSGADWAIEVVVLSGKFALYFVAVVSGIVAAAAGALILPNEPGPTVIAVAVGTATLASLCLWLAWRLDRVAFARFAAVLCLLAVIVAAAVLVVWETIVPGAVVLLLLASIIGGSVGAWLWRYYRTADPVPDVLRELFAEPLLTERLDVQVALAVSTHTLPPLGTIEVRVYLQNCCRGPRRVELSLEPKRPWLGGSRGSLAAPPRAEVELAPAEVGYWSVPIQASEDAGGEFDLWLGLSVRGSRGERIRKKRARELPVRWPWWFRGLGLLAGHLLPAGGAKVRVEVVADASPGEVDPTAGSRWHPLYRPERDGGC